MRVHLHIGAHKTATTTIQSRLSGCGRLAELGVAVAPHVRVRTEISDRLDASASVARFLGPSVETGVARLLADHADARLLIVSDENLAGPMAGVESRRGLYPDVRARLARLLPHFRGHEVKVFVAVRDYATFFSSVYAFRAGLSKASPASVYRERAGDLGRGWADIVADVAEEIDAARVVVWSFERFLEAPHEISDELTGAPGLDLFPATARPRLASLSEKGLAVFERVSDLLSDAELARFSRHLARFEFDQPDRRAEVLDTELAARLSACYRADLRIIEAMGCRVIDRMETP